MLDKNTFCEQIRLCENAMYALAVTLVKNDDDAAEIINESVFRAYKSLHKLKDDAAFKPWILKTVHNTAVDYIRKNSKTVPISSAELIADSSKEALITRLSVRDATALLKPIYRTVIILYYYEDLSISQISRITGCSAVTVKQRLSRARKQLRELLKEDFADERL